MMELFHTDIANTQSAALRQYCKMENVLLTALVRSCRQKNAMKHRIKAAACHLLQSIDKRLDLMIGRLNAEMETGGLLKERLS